MEKRRVEVDPLIFRLYDIRGVVGEQVTPELAYLIGRGYGTLMSYHSKGDIRIVVGRDNRTSSEELQGSIIDGLVATGCIVIDIGLSSSPLVYFAVAHWGLEGGINVTGSHNPLNQNGFKLVGPKAYPFAEENIQRILQTIKSNGFAYGKGKVISKDPRSDYFGKLQEITQIKRRLNVVVDAGNAIMGIFAPVLLRQMGCHVTELYCELDSSFPHHLPNPENPNNMVDLQKEVLGIGADIGFAFDGDGDRIGVVDELGQRYEADYIAALLSKDLLRRHPGAKVLIDVKSSKAVLDYIRTQGGLPILSKVGHSIIKKRMHDEGILLGGETSGHIFLGENFYPIDDALLASCRLLQILSEHEVTFSQLLDEIPKMVSTPMIEAFCPDTEKFTVVQAIKDYFSSKYEVISIDGARIVFPNGWALVRASNTTPSLTLRFEADTQEGLDHIKSIIYNKLREFNTVKLPESD
jgi:phosphomannomutase / phosphoglucomutase